MLPVLLRFNGTVDVVTLPSGNPAILYRFPDLQKRAALPALGAAPPSALAGTAQFGFRRAIGKAASWIQEVRNGGEGSLEAQAGSKDAYVAYSGMLFTPCTAKSRSPHSVDSCNTRFVHLHDTEYCCFESELLGPVQVVSTD